jgi:hypothetical protein
MLIGLYIKKYLVPFNKLSFEMTLICMFLHAILSHGQIGFDGAKISLENYKIFSIS